MHEASRVNRTPRPDALITAALSRRGLLRAGALTAGGLVAATLAACAPGARRWASTPASAGTP
jgi:hypothetical protein